MSRDLLIDDQGSFDDFFRSLSHPTIVGVDTEFMRTDTFFPIPALYQISEKCGSAIIDAQAAIDFTQLKALFLNSSVTKVMHSCSEDLEVIQVQFSIVPESLIDTQLAQAFVANQYSMSYGNLVKEYLGVELEKTSTRSNWLRRPLSDAQLEYAGDDSKYLIPLWEAIKGELESLNRLVWYYEELSRVLSQEHSSENYYRSIKGVRRLDQAQLGILRSLVDWRESEARSANKPRARIVTDAHLLELATRKRSDLGTLRYVLPKTDFDRYQSQVVVALEQGIDDPEPPVLLPRPLSLSQSRVCKILRSLAKEIAEELGIAVELLARKKDVEDCVRSYCLGGALPDWFGKWRKELMGERFIEILGQAET